MFVEIDGVAFEIFPEYEKFAQQIQSDYQKGVRKWYAINTCNDEVVCAYCRRRAEKLYTREPKTPAKSCYVSLGCRCVSGQVIPLLETKYLKDAQA